MLPVAVDDPATLPAGSLSSNAGLDISVLANDYGDLDPTTVTIVSQPNHGTATVDPSSGVAHYTPTAGYSGPDQFSYRVSDHAGQQTQPATVTLSVTPSGSVKALTVPAGGTGSVDVQSGLSGSFDPSTATVEQAPNHGSVAISSGTATYTAAGSYSGPDPFTYRIRDTSGQPLIVTVAVTVTPVAVDDTATTAAEQPVAIAVLANDLGSLDPATLTVTTPSSGGATVQHGAVSYQPAQGFSGADTFTYTVRDTAGQSTSAQVRVTVTPAAATPAAPPAPAPTASNPGFQATSAHQDAGSDRTARFDVFALNGITNPTGWRVTIVGQPAHGQASVQDGVVTYLAAPGFAGSDEVRYALVAPDGQTQTAVLTVTVASSATLAQLPYTGAPVGLLARTGRARSALGSPCCGQHAAGGGRSVCQGNDVRIR